MNKTTNANRGNIQGENITLDFDAPVVTPEVFREAACAFVDLLQGVSDEVGGAETKVQWDIQVKKGSRMFVARPVADTQTTRAATETIKAIKNGLLLLQRESEFQPPYFSQRALKGARVLSSLIEGKKRRVSYIRVRSTGKPCELTPSITASVERLMSGNREAFGSVEGRLRTVSDSDGKLQFVVYDDLFNKGVNCFVNEETEASVIKAFRKRVLVQGMVKSDKEGRPISIRVESIREFREPNELPSIDDLYDIFNKAG